TRDKFEDALRVLAGLLKLAESEGRTRSVIEILMLQALVFEKQGNSLQALVVLSHALSLAEPEEFIRVFVEEGTAMVSLLLKLIEALHKKHFSSFPTISSGYIVKLLEALGICVALPAHNEHFSQIAQSSLIDPLSERELNVLRLIAVGMSNQEIADEMIIALSTVKWHIKHIYGKLNAHRRTQVIARARELQLLD
ncbi:MAG: LuxR C-terminal-related transcriptional regulator, partial [Chloroflexota bacterium]|nr:LuxR C-terminal-related transcriptional regulator [Chloroflexota bacterium]